MLEHHGEAVPVGLEIVVLGIGHHSVIGVVGVSLRRKLARGFGMAGEGEERAADGSRKDAATQRTIGCPERWRPGSWTGNGERTV